MPRRRRKSAIKTGTVNCGFLNVREEPKPNSKKVNMLKQGETVTIDPEFEDKLWYKIEEGYVKKAFIDEFKI